jgi:Holliday junction resolvasome RuvABC ATP-dependent DNA helicase subunit
MIDGDIKKQELITMLEKLKTLDILFIDQIEPVNQNVNYLRKINFEIYKASKVNDRCSKCNREPKYINIDSKQLFCWHHSINE